MKKILSIFCLVVLTIFLVSCENVTTDAPTTVAPTTVAPTTVAPTTVAPTTVAPTTVAPTTVAPTTEVPTTVAPTTEAPTTVAPTTVAPTTEVPTTAEPTTVAPTTEVPTTTTELLDLVSPVISVVAEMQLEFTAGSDAPNWTTYITANDDIDGNITIIDSMVDASSVNMSSVGSYDVVFTVSDSNDNVASLTLTVKIIDSYSNELGEEKYNYQFDSENSGNLAMVNVLEGNGFYINDSGYAETVYLDNSEPVFGNADSWTFVSNGYDQGIEEFVIETKVKALGHATDATSPLFSIRVDYDWMMDIQFSFNNGSWSGVAVHNVPGGSIYSNDAEKGGLAPDLNLALDTEYVIKVFVINDGAEGFDTLIILVNGLKVIEAEVPNVNLNAQHIIGTSIGSHIAVDYFKSNLLVTTGYQIGEEKYNYQFDSENSGNLAMVNVLEGNGFYINDSGYAETVYLDNSEPVYGNADSWTFVSNGYDQGIEEFVIETKVKALGHATDATSPLFSIRVDYDWMMDIQFSFNNGSWSGVAVHNVPGGSIYSNDAEKGGLAPDLNLALDTEYVIKVIVRNTTDINIDILTVLVDGQIVIEAEVPNVNLNAQHIMGVSVGSHIAVDYFKANIIDLE